MISDVTMSVEKNFRSGLYTALVNGRIIGDYTFKFSAKRACKKYIKNNFAESRRVWKRTVRIEYKEKGEL